MTIPGLHDYYEGMHQQMIREIEHAQQSQEPLSSHEQPQSGSCDHTLASNCPIPGTDAVLQESPSDAPSLLDQFMPATIAGIASGAVKWAAELATDALLSQAVLGDIAPSPHADHRDLHVGATDGDGFVPQIGDATCAVVSQQMILHQFQLVDPQTGHPISESRLAQDARAHGWLTDHGTNLSDLGQLLDLYGVANHQGHDWPHLVQDLAAGHQVVMAVNASGLWNEHSLFADLLNIFGNAPNHAIVVKGLKVDDHNRVMVVVNDPGLAHGAGLEFPLEHFQSAVDTRQLHYIATDHAPPDRVPVMPVPSGGTTSHDCGSQIASQEFLEAPSDRITPFAETLSQLTDSDRNAFLRDL